MRTTAESQPLSEPIAANLTEEVRRVPSSSLQPNQEIMIVGVYEGNSLDTSVGKLGRQFARLKDPSDQELLNRACDKLKLKRKDDRRIAQ